MVRGSPAPFLFVFDFDGVIVDSHAHWLGLIRAVQREMGGTRQIPDNVWDQLDDVSFTAMARHLGVPGEQLLGYATRVAGRMLRPDYRPPLFEGIDRVIHALVEHGNVIILSASPAELIRRTIAKAGLDDAIDLVTGGRDPRSKATKLPPLLQRFDARPRRAVMVGDAVSDIRAGQANNMWTAAVGWGWQSAGRLADASPDFLFDRVDDLLTLPERIAAHP